MGDYKVVVSKCFPACKIGHCSDDACLVFETHLPFAPCKGLYLDILGLGDDGEVVEWVMYSVPESTFRCGFADASRGLPVDEYHDLVESYLATGWKRQ